MKPLQRRRRFHRFSTVELLVALALLFFFFPFVEEVKGGDVIVSILLSLVLLSAVLAVADRKGVFYHRACACYSSDCRQVDQSFPAGPGPTARVPYRRTRLDCFCGGEFAPLRLACAFGKHRSALREHLGLPDAWLDVDSSLLARGPGDSRDAFAFNTATRDKTDDGRFQCFLLQLHHTKHGRLRRHHARLKNCALACSNGSDDRAALCHRLDCTPGFTLFHAKVSMIRVPKKEEFFISQ